MKTKEETINDLVNFEMKATLNVPETTKRSFAAGVEWERQKAIEAFKFATDGYFIIGGTNYSAKRLNEFIDKLNS